MKDKLQKLISDLQKDVDRLKGIAKSYRDQKHENSFYMNQYQAYGIEDAISKIKRLEKEIS